MTPLLLLLGARAEPGTACDEQVVLAAVERLQSELDGQRVLLITHGGVMRLLLARARGLPESQLLQVEVGFGALHRLQVEAGLGLTEA